MYIPLYILAYEYGRDEQGYLLQERERPTLCQVEDLGGAWGAGCITL